MSNPLDLPLAFVDLETTGANAEFDRITEIGIVTVDGDTTCEWSQLVQPDVQIPEFIASLTGISNAMVASAPRFETIAEEVRRRLDGHLFIAHNARFDFGFLRREFKRIGVEFRAPVVCTVKLSRKLYPQHHKHSLDTLIARHGLAMESRHRALADARAIRQFWQIARSSFAPPIFDEAVQKAGAQQTLPPHISSESIEALPEGFGVFVFYDAHGKALQVGKSKTLRKRVLTSLSTNTKKNRAGETEAIRRIEGIACSGETGAQLLEARLIASLEPRQQGAETSRSQAFTWRLDEHVPGAWRATLLPFSSIDGGEPAINEFANLYGLFRNQREAKTKLMEVIQLNGLCPALLGLEPYTANKPCSFRSARHCKGACCQKETIQAHRARATTSLEKLRLPLWPFAGPAYLPENDSLHLCDAWRYRGVAQSFATAQALLQQANAPLDAGTFRLLTRLAAQLQPFPIDLAK